MSTGKHLLCHALVLSNCCSAPWLCRATEKETLSIIAAGVLSGFLGIEHIRNPERRCGCAVRMCSETKWMAQGRWGDPETHLVLQEICGRCCKVKKLYRSKKLQECTTKWEQNKNKQQKRKKNPEQLS